MEGINNDFDLHSAKHGINQTHLCAKVQGGAGVRWKNFTSFRLQGFSRKTGHCGMGKVVYTSTIPMHTHTHTKQYRNLNMFRFLCDGHHKSKLKLWGNIYMYLNEWIIFNHHSVISFLTIYGFFKFFLLQCRAHPFVWIRCGSKSPVTAVSGCGGCSPESVGSSNSWAKLNEGYEVKNRQLKLNTNGLLCAMTHCSGRDYIRCGLNGSWFGVNGLWFGVNGSWFGRSIPFCGGHSVCFCCFEVFQLAGYCNRPDNIHCCKKTLLSASWQELTRESAIFFSLTWLYSILLFLCSMEGTFFIFK